jgi:hypothetical protein
MPARKQPRVPNKRVRDTYGTANTFDTDIMKELVKRTGTDKHICTFILENYRDIVIDNLKQGKRVEVKRLGFLCFRLKKGFFSGICGRTIPESYYIKFIFTASLRAIVKEFVTLDTITPRVK